MKYQITGSRDGVRWPPPGEEIDLLDTEGAKLCASGLAEAVVEDKTEKAVVEEKSEKRAPAKKAAGKRRA